jgi:hypothetical protein
MTNVKFIDKKYFLTIFVSVFVLIIVNIQIIFNELSLKPVDRNIFKLTLIMSFTFILFFIEIFLIIVRFYMIKYKITNVKLHKNQIITSAF